MSDSFGGWIPGLDPLTGTLTLPLWAAGAATALFVVFCALALSRAGREGIAGGVARISLMLVGAVVAWFVLEGTNRHDAAAERRALEARADALAARTAGPGSSLACLDGMAGDAVEGACERTLFASPEAMASAVSYTAAKLTLFADVSDFASRGNTDLEPLLASLRRAIETDRYGLVAHVLATRDGCTAEQCAPLVMMRDAGRLTANLTQRTYDFYVARHSAVWPASASGPVANASPGAVPSAVPSLAGSSALVVPGTPRPELFFPSSDSIPPVNIMTAEPAAAPETTGSAANRPPARRPAQKDQPKQQQAPQQTPIDLNSPAARGGAPLAPPQ
jgi:hypothetical protein